MSDFQEYPDVVQEIRGALNPGRLKLQRNSIIFKNSKTGKVDQFQSAEVEKSQWLKRARGFCLKLLLKSGNTHRYDGFKEPDFEKVSKFLQEFYEVTLERVDMSIKGWNWGLAKFVGNTLNFELDSSLVFDIPLTNVSHTTTSKNEVTLEFHQNDDAPVNLMEVRFHIPSDTTNAESDPVQDFHKQVLDSADIIQATGESIVTLSEVQCLTPRGRYDIKMYPSFLQLHGKTFDYKIPFTTILRLFLLPHKDGRQMFFVVSLDPPIKQGQTRYHFLILLFNKEDEMTIEMGMAEEELEQKYEGKLQPEMTGPEYELVSRIFKVITQRKITVPGSFVGHSGTQAIGCSYKAATGLLYPLERGFIFVHKPPLHIRFDEITVVNFGRSAGNTRSFDFDVETKAGTTYNFVGIEKDEYGKLYDFVSGKKLRVKNIGGSLDKGSVTYEEMSGSDDDKGDHDAYLEKMKREGQQRYDDDDSDDSSDVSFNPGESGSDCVEEYDSDPPTTDSEDSDSDYTGGSAGSGSDDSAIEERRERAREKREQEKREKKEKKGKSAKTVPEGGRKKRKTKKKGKDPEAPKRPQSAYFLWLNAHREQIKNDHPGISITEVSKLAGEMWKEVTDRSEWDEKAREAKTEYEILMAEYMEKKRSAKNEQEADDDDDDDDDKKDDDGGDSKKKKPKAKKAATPRKSPKKASKAEGGGDSKDFKSKEFISSDESSSDSEKPLKKKAKKEAKKQEPEEEEEEAAQSSPAASDADDKAQASDSDKSVKSEKSDKSAKSDKSDKSADKSAVKSEEESEAEAASGSDDE